MNKKSTRVICPGCMNLFDLQIPLENVNGWKCNLCHQYFTKEEWLKITYQEYLDSIYKAFEKDTDL